MIAEQMLAHSSSRPYSPAQHHLVPCQPMISFWMCDNPWGNMAPCSLLATFRPAQEIPLATLHRQLDVREALATLDLICSTLILLHRGSSISPTQPSTRTTHSTGDSMCSAG